MASITNPRNLQDQADVVVALADAVATQNKTRIIESAQNLARRVFGLPAGLMAARFGVLFAEHVDAELIRAAELARRRIRLGLDTSTSWKWWSQRSAHRCKSTS